MTNLSHNELIQENIIIVLADHKQLSKEEIDALIMMYIQSDLLEE